MTLCYTPIQLILQMLYICYRSSVRASFARAILVIDYQNPYFSSRHIQTSFTVGKDGIACQSRSNGILHSVLEQGILILASKPSFRSVYLQ